MSCDSCGAEVAETQRVHRRYVTSAPGDQEPFERVLPDVEQWCFACSTQYLHDLA